MAADLFYRVGISAAGASFDLSPDVGALTLEARESQPTKLTVELMDPFKVFGYALQDGMDVEVELGTADDHVLVFRGRIYQVDATFPESGTPTLSMLAYDGLMAMGLRTRNRAFRNQSVSAVVRNVASAYFSALDVSVEGDPVFGDDGVRQSDETDLAFLLRMASEYGCKVYVDSGEIGDVFTFRGQKQIMETEPEVTLYHGRCDVEHRLLSFVPSSDLTQIMLPRTASGIDYDTGELVTVSTAAADHPGDSEDDFVDENLSAFRKRYPDKATRLEALVAAAPGVRAALQQELGASERRAVRSFTTSADLAQQLKNRYSAARQGMRASGATLGNQHLRAQHTISVQDVGGRFSGTWFLTLVRHAVNRTGFRTDFECTR